MLFNHLLAGLRRRVAAESAAQYSGLLAVLGLMTAYFSVRTASFFDFSTVVLIANQIPDLTFIAVGMTLVLVIGQIDLSVGSIAAFSSAVLGTAMVHHGWPLGLAVALGMLIGALCGLFNGLISIRCGIPSFIVTLGMLELARGATKRVLNSQSLYIGAAIEPLAEPLAATLLSPAFLLAVGTVVAGQFLLTRTVFGRYCIAIGTNAEAVRMSGIRVAPYAVGTFVLSGALCALGGLSLTSRMASADPNAATGIELSAIAACVIGGTSLMGGRGNVVSSFLGVLIIAVLRTGLDRLSVNDANKQIITGIVIVIAVLIDALRRRWSERP